MADDEGDYIEMLEFIESLERRNRFQVVDRECDLDILDETDFRARYRFGKNTVLDLVNRFRDELTSGSTRNNPLSPDEKICIALRYYACGAFQQAIGDLNEVSQPSAYRAIRDVSRCLAGLLPTYINLPATEDERREIARNFYLMSNFPGVYGAIDCTHIPIVNPGGDRGETFRCRKGFFSLNVQTVSDPDLLIRNIVACWPGSSHDVTIFNNSSLRAAFESGAIPHNYHLLGDNGYGCRPYLLTPFLEPITEEQKQYNYAHVHARNTVERQYGVWKRRFSCLTGLCCSVSNAMTVIVATAVLHNIAVCSGLVDENHHDEPREDDLPSQAFSFNDSTAAGFAKRNGIVRDFFSY